MLPQWGDGKSDPALTDDELVIDAEKFDPSVRDGLVEFFRKALHRDPDERFDNADEMRWAWQQVFKEAEQRKIKTPSGEEVDLERVAGAGRPRRRRLPPWACRTRARNALERADVITVRDLLEFPISEIHMMRGVGNQTRQEIIRFVSELRERFPNVAATGPRTRRPPTSRRARRAWKPCSSASSAFGARRRKPSGTSGPGCWA